MAAKIDEIDAQIARLRRMREELARVVGCACDSLDRCTCGAAYLARRGREPLGAGAAPARHERRERRQHAPADGIGGAVLSWQDVLHEGPVPAGPRPELLRARARVPLRVRLGRRGRDPRLARAPRPAAARSAARRGGGRALVRARPLRPAPAPRRARAGARDRDGAPELLVVGSFPGKPAFAGLGELTADELETLWPQRRAAPPETLAAAAAAWEALPRAGAGRPRRVGRRARPRRCPYLGAGAPAAARGAARSRRRPLRHRAARAPGGRRRGRDAVAAFAACQRARAGAVPRRRLVLPDARRPRGRARRDAGRRRCRRRRRSATRRRSSGSRCGSPPTASACSRGEADRVELLGLDRWLGGTHLTRERAWRWDVRGAPPLVAVGTSVRPRPVGGVAFPVMDGFFAPGGRLDATLAGYEPRPEQAALADAVERSLASGRHLLAEAGTGVGKSLAYLIPALESGQRVVVATATKALQQQLLANDVPAAAAALGREVRVAVLKGRQNYLCRKNLQGLELLGGALLARADDARAYEHMLPWIEETETGDRAELDFEPSHTLWHELAVGSDRCRGRRCPFLGSCFAEGARERAGEAELVIANHALYFADVGRAREERRRGGAARPRRGRVRRGAPARGVGRDLARRARERGRAEPARGRRRPRLPRGGAAGARRGDGRDGDRGRSGSWPRSRRRPAAAACASLRSTSCSGSRARSSRSPTSSAAATTTSTRSPGGRSAPQTSSTSASTRPTSSGSSGPSPGRSPGRRSTSPGRCASCSGTTARPPCSSRPRSP